MNGRAMVSAEADGLSGSTELTVDQRTATVTISPAAETLTAILLFSGGAP